MKRRLTYWTNNHGALKKSQLNGYIAGSFLKIGGKGKKLEGTLACLASKTRDTVKPVRVNEE